MEPNILPVTSFQQTIGMGTCGPASLKMVLDYFGDPASAKATAGKEKTEEELAKLCGTTKKMGTSAESLKKAAESLGFTVEIKQYCTFEDIQVWLDKKVPVIVDWFSSGRKDYDESEMADGHYSVVVGLDRECIYLQDPELGKLRNIGREDFMRVWFDFTGEYIDSKELVVRQIIAIYK